MEISMRLLRAALAAVLCTGLATGVAGQRASETKESGMADVRFMTLDPGHFHAGLVQKEMYPGVAPRVDVYAPLGADLLGHLARINGFNSRADQPTSWRLEVHTGPDFFERMIAEHPGNVVVISGRNRGKIDRIGRSVAAGLHVLADKPWILRSADLPALERALADADARHVVAYDIMTERFEVTSEIQRALVNDTAISGGVPAGTADKPSVYMESIHHLMKVVAGAPNIRPAWFFDTAEQGEGLNDIGTHLVDLVQWTLFPEQSLDYKADVRVLSAQQWPTLIPESDFKKVTGSAGFPDALRAKVVNGALSYDCNTLVSYRVRGVHTTLNVIWDWEAPQGAGDRHYAVYRGAKSSVEVRQTKADKYQTEVYVIPNPGEDASAIAAAVKSRLASLQADYPGVKAERNATGVHVVIPDRFRDGHEAHFARVTRNFLKYLGNRTSLPAWERPNMLAKYFVTTTGTELSHQSPPKPAPRIAPE
jgi:predicted dehydrogenase